MTADDGNVAAEHHLGDISSLPGQVPVTCVNRHASQGDDSGGIQDADDLVRDVGGEQSPEGYPSVGEPAHLQQEPGPPGLEDIERPGLSFVPGGRDAPG